MITSVTPSTSERSKTYRRRCSDPNQARACAGKAIRVPTARGRECRQCGLAELKRLSWSGLRSSSKSSFLLPGWCVRCEFAGDVVAGCGASADVEDSSDDGRICCALRMSFVSVVLRRMGDLRRSRADYRIGFAKVTGTIWGGLERVGTNLSEAVVGVANTNGLISRLQCC